MSCSVADTCDVETGEGVSLFRHAFLYTEQSFSLPVPGFFRAICMSGALNSFVSASFSSLRVGGHV